MTIRKLEIFYLVSMKLNMTIAAKELYISQPSISQVIKELEEDLKVKLFQRIGRKLYLTDEGLVFQKYALRIINLYNESRRAIEDMRDLQAGHIKIGASTTIGTYLLPDIIADFKKLYPGVNIELLIENTNLVSKEILKNTIDLGFIEGDISHDELETKNIWEDELIIISSPCNQWKDVVPLSKLSTATFIQREEGSGSRQTYEKFIGRRQDNSYIFGSIEAIKRGVKKNLGVACVSRLTVEEEEDRGELKVSRIKGKPIKRTLKLLFHKDKEFSNLIRSFIDFANTYI